MLKSKHLSKFFDDVGRVRGSVVRMYLFAESIVAKDAEEVFDGIVGADLTMWE